MGILRDWMCLMSALQHEIMMIEKMVPKPSFWWVRHFQTILKSKSADFSKSAKFHIFKHFGGRQYLTPARENLQFLGFLRSE